MSHPGFETTIEDTNQADIGLEVVSACANGAVDHALLFGFPPMPPPDPVIEVDDAPVLEMAVVLHARQHERHDELNLIYNDEITVLKKNTDGWWYGKRVVWNKRQDRSWFEEGWFPASYVQGNKWLLKQSGDHWGGNENDDWDIHVVESGDSSLVSDDRSSLGSYGAKLVGQGVSDILAKGVDDFYIGRTASLPRPAAPGPRAEPRGVFEAGAQTSART